MSAFPFQIRYIHMNSSFLTRKIKALNGSHSESFHFCKKKLTILCNTSNPTDIQKWKYTVLSSANGHFLFNRKILYPLHFYIKKNKKLELSPKRLHFYCKANCVAKHTGYTYFMYVMLVTTKCPFGRHACLLEK